MYVGFSLIKTEYSMKVFTFLTTTMLIVSIQADTRMEAIQSLKSDGYTIVKQL